MQTNNQIECYSSNSIRCENIVKLYFISLENVILQHIEVYSNAVIFNSKPQLPILAENQGAGGKCWESIDRQHLEQKGLGALKCQEAFIRDQIPTLINPTVIPDLCSSC